MIIKVEAFDTLFFKDGKPFSMGEESWADGIFPPPPSVIYGAMRSVYFGQNPNEFKKAGLADDPTKDLIISGIYYSVSDEINVPTPLDFVKKKNDKENTGKLFPMKLSEIDNISNNPLGKTLNFKSENHTIEEVESSEASLVRKSKFMNYLNGSNENFSVRDLTDLMLSEPKVGIGRENFFRAASEGKLYRVGMRRLESMKTFGKLTEKINVLIEFENLELKKNGFFKFGAEGKIVSYVSTDHSLLFSAPKISGSKFKVYMLTPGLFKNGWHPDFKEHPLLKDFDLELVTASIGKPINIGGFDMQKKIPKPMRKAVPSGSIYYVKSKDDVSKFIDKIHGKSISDYNANEGFGICFIGGLND